MSEEVQAAFETVREGLPPRPSVEYPGLRLDDSTAELVTLGRYERAHNALTTIESALERYEKALREIGPIASLSKKSNRILDEDYAAFDHIEGIARRALDKENV